LPPARTDILTAAAGTTLSPVLVLQPGTTVSLRAVDPDGVPIAGVLTELFPVPETPRFKLREPDTTGLADEQGLVVLDQVAVGEATLHLSRAGFVIRVISPVEVPQDGLDLGEIELEPGVTLEGVTVDPRGRPVGDAEIALDTDAETGYFRPAAFSDSSGHFAIPDLAAKGEVYLRARAPGLVPRPTLKVTMPPDGPVELMMERERLLSGIVTETGTRTPLADVKVSVLASRTRMVGSGMVTGSRYPVGSATTDRAGRFTVAGIAPGSYELYAISREHQRGKLEVTVAADRDPEPVRISLERGLSLSVQVLDTKGRPTAASLQLRPVDTRHQGASGSAGETQTDGTYTFHGLGEGSYWVTAWSEAQEYAKAQGEAGGELTLELEASASIAGSVLDPDGRPLPEIEVQVSAQGTQVRDTTTTDANGRFHFASVIPGQWYVIVRTESYPVQHESVTVASGEEAEVELRLEPGGVITGTVLGLGTSELEHCHITSSGFVSARVKPDGTFRLEGVRLGTQTVTAQVSSQNRSRSVQVEVSGGDEPIAVELDFGSGFTLAGRIRQGGSATPSAGLVVAVSGLAAYSGGSTVSDAAGDWSIDGLTAGEYLVELKGSVGQVLVRRQILVDSDTRLDLDLPPGSISGLVLTADSRIPVSGALLLASGHGSTGIQRKVSSDGDGRFMLADLPDGIYSLQADAATDGSAHETVEISNGLAHELTLLVEPQQDLVLLVREPDGTGAARIWVEMLQGGLTQGIRAACDTGGRCPVRGLPDGAMTLFVYGNRSGAVLAASTPGSSEIPVSLRPMGMLETTAAPGPGGEAWRFRIVDAATGLVIPRWHQLRPGGEWIAASRDELPLPQGTYLVEGLAPSGEIEQQQVEVPARGTAEVSFPAS
jgi:protocatechuate 3,4-dioxygenase beta subunit